jgi:hypothetical protein
MRTVEFPMHFAGTRSVDARMIFMNFMENASGVGISV